ncbi:MAG: phosphoserine phosphatase SerB [Actinobacteria bacterium]|nr:phosphoserine phosphatase SerB [Actinomycetota bacterium]
MTDVLILTVSGKDQPGVTAGLTTTLSELPVYIRQLEQIVLQGHLILGVSLMTREAHNQAIFAQATTLAEQFAQTRNLSVASRVLHNDELSSWREHLIVTVLGAPLLPASVASITATIAQAGGNIDRIRQVATYPVTAVEFEVGGVSKGTLRDQLSAVARENKIDIAVQESGLDRRGIHLIVMDVDSTFIQHEVIELLAARAGVEAQVADITARAMNGELDFEESLRLRVAMLRGLPESALTEVLSEISFTPGAKTLTRTLNRIGFQVALVSGGFIEVVKPLADALGVTNVRANKLEIADGVLTGELEGPIIDRQAKAEALREFAAHYGIPMSRTIAIGDGANDLDMLNEAALGIAFNAKPFVRDAAHASVNTPYLDTVLYVLGITREQIERSDAAEGIETPAPEVPI